MPAMPAPITATWVFSGVDMLISPSSRGVGLDAPSVIGLRASPGAVNRFQAYTVGRMARSALQRVAVLAPESLRSAPSAPDGLRRPVSSAPAAQQYPCHAQPKSDAIFFGLLSNWCCRVRLQDTGRWRPIMKIYWIKA